MRGHNLVEVWRVRSVGKILVRGLIAYLLAGLLFGLLTMPEQQWACPDPSEPHGYVWHGGSETSERIKRECRAEVDFVDRARWVVFATVAGPLLFLGKSASNATDDPTEG